MAKAKTQSTPKKIQKPKVKRKGIHAKSKAARGKQSKNYLKLYSGQG